jgi:hypothetical protein
MAVLAVLALVAGIFFALGSASADSIFKPTTGVKLCNALPGSGFGDGSVNGNPSCADATNDGVTVTNTLPSGNVYFSSQVTFIPTGGAPAPGSAATLAGGVRTTASFGVSNAPCNAIVDEDFVLYNVALPDNVSDPRASSNIVYPLAVGTTDRFSKWKVGSEPTGADPSGIDTGGDPNYAVGTSLAFNYYPSYLLDTFDADGVGGAPPLYPEAVYGALTNFGGQWRPLFLVKLAPSSMPSYSPVFPAGAAAKPAMGSPLVWVLGDPRDGVPTPDNITDTCSPSTTTITLTGTTSLATGTNFYLEYLSSGRDLDQDGYENAIDTCPLKVNVGNPRTGTGDTDADGIDDACDPGTPTPVTADDFDGDGFANRGDTCALVSNPSQSEAERLAAPPADRGPVVDNIGDACDGEGGTIAVVQNCSVAPNGGINPTPCATPNLSITLSDTVANGRYMTVTNVVAKCVGGTDADGDGYCATQDSGDSGACETTAPPSCTTRHNQWTSAQPMMQMDTDGDKQSDALETYVGTDPVQSCSQTTGNNNEPMDNWMFALTDHTFVNGQDDGLYAAYDPFHVAGGVSGAFVAMGPFTLAGITRPGVRFDFNADGVMNGQDSAKFGGVGPYGGTGPMNKTCASAGIPAFHQQ